MKKKKLLKKIYQLEEINEYLGLQNIRLRMKLAGTCTQEEAKGTILERTKEPESKEQNDKRREIYEAQKPIGFPKVKTEGPESESELKENAISLEIRKKYLTRNGIEMTCWEKTSTGRYECTNEGDTFYYEKDGTLPGLSISWDIVSEVKE